MGKRIHWLWTIFWGFGSLGALIALIVCVAHVQVLWGTGFLVLLGLFLWLTELSYDRATRHGDSPD